MDRSIRRAVTGIIRRQAVPETSTGKVAKGYVPYRPGHNLGPQDMTRSSGADHYADNNADEPSHITLTGVIASGDSEPGILYELLFPPSCSINAVQGRGAPINKPQCYQLLLIQ